MTTNERNYSYDILKAFGIAVIVFAHCYPLPNWLNYLRNFEVILLVLISAIFQFNKYGSITHVDRGIIVDILKRLLRLIVPTWVFLTILFSGLLIVSAILGTDFPYSLKIIIDSYAMINGIGYVWIMLVYCFISVGLPFLFAFFNRFIANNYLKVLVWLSLLIVYEAFRFLILKLPDSLFVYYFKNTFLYLIAYNLISLVPYICKQFKQGFLLLFGLAFLIIHVLYFIVLLVYEQNIVDYIATTKYPPSLYYYSYGIGISSVLIYLADRFVIIKNKAFWIVPFVFISKRSLWIYFNHIFMIYVFNQLSLTDSFVIMYLFVFAGAILITFVIDIVFSLIKKSNAPRFFVSTIKLIWG